MKAQTYFLATRPIAMVLFCPNGHRHIDTGAFAEVHHHTHACQACGLVWRPAVVPTIGVRFLPGFKNRRKRRARQGLIMRAYLRIAGLLAELLK